MDVITILSTLSQGQGQFINRLIHVDNKIETVPIQIN